MTRQVNPTMLNTTPAARHGVSRHDRRGLGFNVISRTYPTPARVVAAVKLRTIGR
jgi:hypothetical protein